MTTKFDERYNIRFATSDDIPTIMQFIKEEWGSNHILARSRDFFCYEHVVDGEVTFLIAEDKNFKEIFAILGYYYSSNEKANLDVWTGIWKAKSGAMALLGLELMKRLRPMLGARSLSGVGDNPQTTVPLMKIMMKAFTGKMEHYYRLSTSLPYRIACVKNLPVTASEDSGEMKIQIRKVDSSEKLKSQFDFKMFRRNIPYKNEWYFERRYFNHPIFSYNVYILAREEKPEAIMVLREQACNGSKILRVIDYFGNQQMFSYTYSFWEKQLKEYEYVDFYTLGFESQYIKDAGFCIRTSEEQNIIPNYFYPYEQKNVDIWVDSSSDDILFMKGDGDQDRPN